MKYLVTEYNLNRSVPYESTVEIDADSAVEAIRKMENWRYASSFTHRECNNWNVGNKLQAHTQNRNGTFGCEAIAKEVA